MPAPKTVFIPHSCFGYYDEKFEECSKKCKIWKECRKATMSEKYEEIRSIYKYRKKQIAELVEEWSDSEDEKKC